MFQSVSGHSSGQSTAHFSSRSTVSKLKGLLRLFQTDFRIANQRGHKFSPSLTPLSVKNSDRLASRLTAIDSFPSPFIQRLQYSGQHPSFSAHWAALMTKTELTFPDVVIFARPTTETKQKYRILSLLRI